MLPMRITQLFIVSTALTVLYIAAAPLLFTYLFPKYLPAILVSQVLAVTTIFQSKNIIDVFFTAHGQVWNRSRVILISQAVEFALFFVLIPFFGLWGAVWATVCSELFAAIIYIWIYFRSRSQHLA